MRRMLSWYTYCILWSTVTIWRRLSTDSRSVRTAALSWFLPRDAMHSAHTRGLCCRKMSVRLSVACQYSVQTAEHVIKLFHHPVAAAFSFLRTHPNSMAILRRPPPPLTGRQMYVRYEKMAISTNISFISEMTQDRGLSNGGIFSDLERPLIQFQGHAIIWRWISPKQYGIQTSLRNVWTYSG